MARGRKAAVVETGPVEGPWDLPEGWQWAAMGSIADIIAGQSPPSSTYNQSGRGLPFFQGKAEFGKLHPVATKWCTEPTKVAEPDDILISVRAPVGPTNIADRRCGIGRGLAAIRSGPRSTTSWIRNWLLLSRGRLVAQATGTTFEAISGDVLRHHPIPVPPLDTQRRIVARIDELFSELDDGEAALARARADLETYRKSLLKAAVTGELTADWRAANPPTETGEQLLKRILADRKGRWEADPKSKGKRYKEPEAVSASPPSDLPLGWAWASVQQLSTLVTSGSRGWSDYYAPEGSLFIRAANLNKDRLDLSDVAYVALPEGAEGTRTKVCMGDLLITITGANVTKSGIVTTQLDDAYVSQHVGLVRPVFAELASYLHLWCRAYGGGKRYLMDAAYGAGKPGLNLPNLYEMPVALPPPEEREEIERRLQGALQPELCRPETDGLIESMRQSILAAAFLGELVQ